MPFVTDKRMLQFKRHTLMLAEKDNRIADLESQVLHLNETVKSLSDRIVIQKKTIEILQLGLQENYDERNLQDKD